MFFTDLFPVSLEALSFKLIVSICFRTVKSCRFSLPSDVDLTSDHLV